MHVYFVLDFPEEELKRLNQAFNECNDVYGSYGAVGFNYSYGGEEMEENESEAEKDCEYLIFVVLSSTFSSTNLYTVIQ